MTARPRCQADGCTNPTRAAAPTWAPYCNACYLRLNRYGTHVRHYEVNDGQRCAATGCTLPAQAKRLCATHYAEWLLAGRPPVGELRADAQPRPTCTRCGRPVHARGLCNTHYRAALRAEKRSA